MNKLIMKTKYIDHSTMRKTYKAQMNNLGFNKQSFVTDSRMLKINKVEQPPKNQKVTLSASVHRVTENQDPRTLSKDLDDELLT